MNPSAPGDYALVPVSSLQIGKAEVPSLYGPDGRDASEWRAVAGKYGRDTVSSSYLSDDSLGSEDDEPVRFPYSTNKGSKRDMPINGHQAYFDLWRRHCTLSSAVHWVVQAMVRNGYEVVPKPGYEDVADPAERDELLAFLDDCHPFYSFEELLGQMLPCLVLQNWTYAEIAYSDVAADTPYGRKPRYIFPDVPLDSLRPNIGRDGLFKKPTAWFHLPPGADEDDAIEMAWEQVLWLRLPAPIKYGIYPMAPVDQLEVTLKTDIAAKDFIRSFFTSAGKVGLVFTMPPGGNQKDKAMRWLKFIDQYYVRGGMKTMVLYDGMQVQKGPLAKADNAEWTNVLDFDQGQVCGVIGIDPRLIGAMRSVGLGGVGEREQAYNEAILNAVNPRVKMFNAIFTKQVIEQGFGIQHWMLRLRPDVTNVSETSRQLLVNTFDKAIEKGIVDGRSLEDMNAMRAEAFPGLKPYAALPPPPPKEIFAYDYEHRIVTVNEARESKGRPPIEGGDVLVEPAAPATMIDGIEQRPPGTGPTGPVTFLPMPTTDEKEPAPKKEKRAVLTPEDEELEHQLRRLEGYATRAQEKPWLSRINVRATNDFYAIAETELSELMKTGVLKMAEEIVPKVAKLYASEDKSGLRKLNLVPGGSELMKKAKDVIVDFYGASKDFARTEISDVVRAFKKRADDEDEGEEAGDIKEQIDLVSKRFFDDIFGSVEDSVVDSFARGLSEGWTREEMIDELMAQLQVVSERDVNTAVRTATTEFFTDARLEVYHEADGAVEAVEFSAILDDRTTEECLDLDETIFELGDPNLSRATPPVHYNCRSNLVPILVGDKWKATPEDEVDRRIAAVDAKFQGRARWRRRRVHR